MSRVYQWFYDRWKRSALRRWARTLDLYQAWRESALWDWLTRLRVATGPIRHSLRGARNAGRVQRSVPLLPEDATYKRKRQHVLVDLIHEQFSNQELFMAEIGTDNGQTAAHITRYCPQIKKLVAVDLEAPSADDDQLRGIDRIQFIKGYSDEVAKQFEDEHFDIVFVDADHSEEWVDRDVHAWFPKVKKGGIIAGHDYGANHFPGVRIAVDRFFERHPYPIKIEANKVWWTHR